MNIDLHCHSTASDGLLSPSDVVKRAAQNGVTTLALTDHDDTSGLAAARAAAASCGITLVPGVEISVTWRDDATIHVVGLGIDENTLALQDGLARTRSGRLDRARSMAAELEAIGIKGCFEGALHLAGNPNIVSRAHFARYLVNKGHAPHTAAVFQRYLVRGKPGYVAHIWASLHDALEWIQVSGGVAVLAHPARYTLPDVTLSDLLSEFRELGGEAIEVVSGTHTRRQIQRFTAIASERGLLASRGSDFHGPEARSKIDLGRLPMLAESLTPVWTHPILQKYCH